MLNPFTPVPVLPLGAAACLVACCSPAAVAAESPRRQVAIERGDAADTLGRFAREYDKEVLYLVDSVRGVSTNGVRGELTAREALVRMLANTGLVLVEDEKSGAFLVNPGRARSAQP